MSSKSTIAALKREILALRRQDGSLAPEDIVEWARAHPKSELHKLFEWDNERAAHEHRLRQARQFIQEYSVVVDGSEKEIEVVALVSVPSRRGKGEGSYLSQKAVAANQAYRTEVLDEVRSKLRSMKDRYETLTPELAKVWKAIQQVC